MHLGRLVLFWIARHLFALVLILFVLIAGRYLIVPGWNWAKAEIREAREIDARQQATAEASARLQAYARQRRERADAAFAALPATASERLRQRLSEIPTEQAAHEKALLSGPALALAGISGRSDRIFGHYKASAEIALLTREREMIEALLEVPRVRAAVSPWTIAGGRRSPGSTLRGSAGKRRRRRFRRSRGVRWQRRGTCCAGQFGPRSAATITVR